MGVGVEHSKNRVTSGGGGSTFFLERDDKPEKGGLCRNRGLPLFYYFTFQLHLLCVWEKPILLYYFLRFSLLI